jgi:DNA-damage-inducible protein D
MAEGIIPFENGGKELSFEDFKNENGSTFWWASDLMVMLGYRDMKSFQRVIDRATKAFVSLNISHYENIIPYSREIDGKNIQDFKLSRFASYLVTMNGDPKKVEVATAQSYFASQTRKFELYVENSGQFDRILIRDELTDGNKSLNAVAKSAGVVNYAYFQDAGIRGLYNMGTSDLKRKRKLSGKDNIADYMGRTELAANLFRVTQTEERIKNKGIKGQSQLEATHSQVGKEVRAMVQKNVGKSPEDFANEKHLPQIKKDLKDGYKKMLKEDKPKK